MKQQRRHAYTTTAGAGEVIYREENFCVTGAVTQPTLHIT